MEREQKQVKEKKEGGRRREGGRGKGKGRNKEQREEDIEEEEWRGRTTVSKGERKGEEEVWGWQRKRGGAAQKHWGRG